MSDDFAPWDAEGRVNAVRMDFNEIDYATPGLNQFDVCFVGFFRDMEDAEGYVYDYLGVEKPAETESTTEEATTEAPEETTDTTTETTKAPEQTTGADSDDNTANDDEKSGCGSVVGFGAVAVVTTIGAVAFVTFKKKKED